MTDQTDAEFIAEMKALAKEATKQVEAYGASAPLLKFANAARTAIPRLIGIVEAEKKRADDAEAERDSLRINAVDDAFVKRIMEMPDAELLASVEPGEIDLNKQLFKTAKMQVERDTALAEVARLRNAVDFASAPVSGWRPMESAPRDGTLFLAAWQPLPAPPKGREGE